MDKKNNIADLLRGKSLSSYYKLEKNNHVLNNIIEYLKSAKQTINKIIEDDKNDTIDSSSRACDNSNKKIIINVIDKIFNRIEFERNHLYFYIDFTISQTGSDDITDIIGNIVYGVNRPMCFNNSIYSKTNNQKCRTCDSINECDYREDKPLMKFNINKEGIISSNDQLEDNWHLLKNDKEEQRKNIANMHFRAIEYIWIDALYWVNEKLLP